MHRFTLLSVLTLTALTLGTAGEARADEPAPPAKTGDPVFLHVQSDATVTIERDGTNEVVCTSPCDKDVPKSATYHVGGHRPSSSFTLTPPKSGRADLQVKPGSTGGFVAGIIGVSLSAVLIGGGIATLVYGMNNRNEVQGAEGVDTDNSYTDTMTVGTVLVLGGVVAGIGGGALLIANAKTRVEGNMQSARDMRPAPAPSPSLVALPRPHFVSLVSGSF